MEAPKPFREVTIENYIDDSSVMTVTVAPEYAHLSRKEFAEKFPEAVIQMKARMFDLLYDQHINGGEFDQACDDVMMESDRKWSYAHVGKSSEEGTKTLTMDDLLQKQIAFLHAGCPWEVMNIKPYSIISCDSLQKLHDARKQNSQLLDLLSTEYAKTQDDDAKRQVLAQHYFIVTHALDCIMDKMKEAWNLHYPQIPPTLDILYHVRYGATSFVERKTAPPHTQAQT
jgi:hypothetical protein